jgi:inner membrane protein
VDALTHGLAAYALTRVARPRASRLTTIGAVLAGTAADLDSVAASFGPSAYLACHRTFTHSIVAALAIAATLTLVLIFAQQKRVAKDSLRLIFATTAGASLLHLAMDLCQNDGAEALWPFGPQRYSADWVAHLDLWILLMLVAGVLLPLLLQLVTEEIGAKAKAPRGRTGALLALLAVVFYIGGRAILHGDAVALLESRTYRGELPRRVAAFAESDSLLHWHGIVETERALHEFDLNVGTGSSFDSDRGVTSYKPEPSAGLNMARNTEAAQRFLRVARFPKATVEQTNTGFRVEIRDLAQQRDTHSGRNLVAVIELDPHARVTDDQITWDRPSRQP